MRMHALFKSLLFLRCGSLMSGLGGGQDSRFFGFSFSSVSGVCFLTRALRLCGFPFSVGFYSKDLIVLEACFGGFRVFVFLGFFVGCLFTVGYSVRLIVLGFLEGPLGDNYLSVGDDRFFVCSVLFLWVWASFSGGFFGGTFIGSDCFLVGGFDYFLGIFIICLGVFVVLFGLGALFFYRIGYLRFISMGGSSWGITKGSFVLLGDATWLEILGGRGVFSGFIELGSGHLSFFRWGFGGSVLFLYGYFFYLLFC